MTEKIGCVQHDCAECVAREQRTWVGLTPTEIELIVCYPWGETANWVRAIEKALKDKNI